MKIFFWGHISKILFSKFHGYCLDSWSTWTGYPSWYILFFLTWWRNLRNKIFCLFLASFPAEIRNETVGANLELGFSPLFVGTIFEVTFVFVIFFGYFAIRIKAKSFSFKRHFFQTQIQACSKLETENWESSSNFETQAEISDD